MNKNSCMSDESKQKISNSLYKYYKEHKVSQEIREKLSLALKGRKLSEEAKQKLRKPHKQVQNTPEMKALRSIISKNLWNNPEFREKTVKNRIIAAHLRPTKPEREVLTILNNLYPNEYKYTGNGEIIIGKYCPDFININGQKKVIEVHGDYWHRNDDVYIDIARYKNYGFDCLIIWEHELENHIEVIKKVQAFHNNMPFETEQGKFPENYHPSGKTISEALRGIPKSPEHRKKLADALRGKKLPQWHKDKIKQGLLNNPNKRKGGFKKGSHLSPEHIANISKGITGRVLSEESRKKMSDSIKQHYKLHGNPNKGIKGRQVAWNKGLTKLTDSRVEKCAASRMLRARLLKESSNQDEVNESFKRFSHKIPDDDSNNSASGDLFGIPKRL